MDKKEALKKLNVLETEVKNLRAIIGAPEDIKERIKSYHDACEYLDVDPDHLPFEDPDNKEEEAINAEWMMWRITQALNENWKPNWDNSDEYKWYPYFDMRSAGVGFSNSDFVSWHAGTTVGSRLCFKSRELAEYAGAQFKDIYKKFMVITGDYIPVRPRRK
jgi:hypothetical protein